MKETRTAVRLPDGRLASIAPDLHGILGGAPALVAMAAVLFAGNAAPVVHADQVQTTSASAGQAKNAQATEDENKAYQAIPRDLEFVKRAVLLFEFLEKYPNSKLLQQIDYQHLKMLNRDEYNAYRAARRETDFDKRALMLIDFLDKYPQTKLMEKTDYENIKPLEDQHAAYDVARQESDPQKRAVMLIDFLQKYPKSTLVQNIHYDYPEMMRKASREKKYDVLESLAENWLKIHPEDRNTYGFLAEAANNLGKFEKCARAYEEIYKMEPSSVLAREIYTCYQKTESSSKQIEWAERLSKTLEFKDDYMLHFDLVMRYWKANNLPKAVEHAELTLKSVNPDKQSDAKVKEQVRKVHRICHHIIASDLLEKKVFADAISAYKEALKDEKYAEGYYGIGLCLDNQKAIEDANLYYAMAELMGGESASKAKARLETLYKALHNNTLVGLDKVYQKARESMQETLD
jgi:hypothetical protein